MVSENNKRHTFERQKMRRLTEDGTLGGMPGTSAAGNASRMNLIQTRRLAGWMYLRIYSKLLNKALLMPEKLPDCIPGCAEKGPSSSSLPCCSVNCSFH